jgi:hypothetical protein
MVTPRSRRSWKIPGEEAVRLARDSFEDHNATNRSHWEPDPEMRVSMLVRRPPPVAAAGDPSPVVRWTRAAHPRLVAVCGVIGGGGRHEARLQGSHCYSLRLR